MHRSTLGGVLANSRSAPKAQMFRKTTTVDQLRAGLLRVSTAEWQPLR